MSASAEKAGTAAYAARFAHPGFYRQAKEWTLSSLGIGTYLGAPDQETTTRYTAAVRAAVAGGINLLDTSLNYRNQQSELAIGEALAQLQADGLAQRNELVLCTKAGYLVPGALPENLPPSEIAAKCHSLEPGFLRHQLQQSLQNLRTPYVDVFYLHNPETQLGEISLTKFGERLRAAFAVCEEMAAQGLLRYYGMATWDGFRAKPDEPIHLDLHWVLHQAQAVAGRHHHFGFLQLPFNLGMPEAYARYNQRGRRTLVATAQELGVEVVASAALLQGRLAKGLPHSLHTALPDQATDAERALQFARSAPGITAALVGMSRPEHVATALRLAQQPPLRPDLFEQLFFGEG